MTYAARTRTVEQVITSGVVAVVRLEDGSRLREVARALGDGGVRAIEITMTMPRAVALVESLAAELPSNVVLGAGTVLDAATARDVIRAGACFVVSPVFKREVVDACGDADCAVIPGALTPTEILQAWEAGGDIVKVFPSTSLGPTYFKDLRGPLPHVRVMPTGGVTRENAGAWIRAGAVAIGAGSALVDPAVVRAGRFDVIRENARAFVAAVASARGQIAGGVTS
jgi:2-dehydro-3-deoxyphosphogluconate aldolase / (4S)-4-hydroxy-2-oxoglutarate aldolase